MLPFIITETDNAVRDLTANTIVWSVTLVGIWVAICLLGYLIAQVRAYIEDEHYQYNPVLRKLVEIFNLQLILEPEAHAFLIGITIATFTPVALEFVFHQFTFCLVLSISYLILRLARFCRRLQKKFILHVEDKKIHK